MQTFFWLRHPVLHMLWALGRGVLLGLILVFAPVPIQIAIGVGVLLVWPFWIFYKTPPISRRTSCQVCGEKDTLPTVKDLRPIKWWEHPSPTIWLCIEHLKELAKKESTEPTT